VSVPVAEGMEFRFRWWRCAHAPAIAWDVSGIAKLDFGRRGHALLSKYRTCRYF